MVTDSGPKRINKLPTLMDNNNTNEHGCQVELLSNESRQKLYYHCEDGAVSTLRKKRILVGYKALRRYLRPVHPYFADKIGVIKKPGGWVSYLCRKGGNVYVFPQVDKTLSAPLNPYMLFRKASQSALKSLRGLKTVAKAFKLPRSTKVVSIVFTFPKEISESLCNLETENGKGVKNAWKLWQVFFKKELEPFYTGTSFIKKKRDRIGARVALHVWGSKNPFSPHYHFHVLLLNQVLSGKEKTFKEVSVHLTPQQLRELKRKWTKFVLQLSSELAVKVNLSLSDNENDEKLCNVYYEYALFAQRDSERLNPKVIHTFKYINRSPLLDFADYSIDAPKCPSPPDWLEQYENRVRVYGWFRILKTLLAIKGVSLSKEDWVVCPLCGDTLAELGPSSLFPEEWERGPPLVLVALDWVKGRPHLVDVDYMFLVECEEYPL